MPASALSRARQRWALGFWISATLLIAAALCGGCSSVPKVALTNYVADFNTTQQTAQDMILGAKNAAQEVADAPQRPGNISERTQALAERLAALDARLAALEVVAQYNDALVKLSEGDDPAQVGALLGRTIPGARFIAEQATVQPLLASLRALRWLSVALVLLMAAATSAAVVLAARGALDTHRSTIETMHGIGATDQQVALLFQRKIALDALAGAVAGGLAAALALIVIGAGGLAMASDLAGGPPLRVSDFVVLALMPVAAVLLATLVARFAVLSALHKVI